jgi:ATP-binding cassette, subfamily B, bacterial
MLVMSMETAAWTSMYHSMLSTDERRPFSRETVRRILTFVPAQKFALAAFLVVSVAGAFLAVATPVIAGWVVDAIIDGEPRAHVIRLALLIGIIALTEGALGFVGWSLSSRIGERLILDLRMAVFNHVQSMPIAFFTRTRTGALVSRLNNDVIGAQRAFSDVLSRVVSNLVMLILTLAVMLGISWQLTLAALLLLPVFLVPARFIGRRLAGLQRASAQLDADMATRMTERFSAPGAMLAKLFSRPEQESA